MPIRFHIRPGALCLLVAFGATASLTPDLPAQSANAPLAVNNEVVEVTAPRTAAVIVEQFTKVLKSPTRITHVDGFDQAVVDVTALSPTELQVKGMAPGATTIIITDERNQRREVVARVISRLQAHLSRLFPGANIEVVHISPESIVLRGWVTQPDHVSEVVDIAGQFYAPNQVLNQLRVGGAQQVQLNVKVMEIQRSKLRRLGLNFRYMDDAAFIASTPGNIGALSTIQAAVFDEDSSFDALVEALRDERLLKILSEPKLVTTNGRPANMLAGGEFPVPLAQGLGTVTVQWREFGVRLEAVPYVLGNGRLRLELSPEVSEQDFTNSFEISGFQVTGLTTRRVNTQVEMKFGQTIMLAGLLSMRTTAQAQKIPFFGELPWIGSAFRRVRHDEFETELVILVTPELVAAMDPSQVPPLGPGQFTDAPTDRELFGYGLLEVPNYGPHCPDCQPGGRVIPLPPHTDFSGEMIAPETIAPPRYVPPLPGGPASPHMMPPMAPGAAEELQPPPSVLELEQAVSGATPGGKPAGTQWARTAGARTAETGNTSQQTSYTGSTSTSDRAAAPRPVPRPAQEAGRARLTPSGAVQPGTGGLLQPVQR